MNMDRKKNALLLVGAQRAIEAAELSTRRLWVETLALGGTVPDVQGRLAEVRELVDEMESALLVLVEHAQSDEVRELRTLARAEGLVAEEEVEEFVVRRLEASNAEDQRLAELIAAGDGRSQVSPLPVA
jgi:uncharacterized protein YigA (DUF484 family)